MPPRIIKPPAAFQVPPNLSDYDKVCASFTWEAARHALDGLPQGRGLNIAHEAVTRHALGPRSGRGASCGNPVGSSSPSP